MLPLIAAEYHGQVKFNSLPLPGATITATQGDKKLTAVSNDQGAYSFPDLPNGTWQLEVDMVGFTPIKQEATPGSGLPGPDFELKMLPMDQIESVTAAPAPAIVVGPATTVAPNQTITTAAPAAAPAAQPTPSIVASVAAANAAANKKGKKGAVPAGPASSFQQTSLNGNANAAPADPAPAAEVTNDLTKKAADGLLINGSSQNGASSPFAQNPAFGNNRKGGPRQYQYSLTVNDSNSALNAAPFSLIGQSVKPPQNQLTGGFNFQGPIKIPHLIERNGPSFGVFYTRVENRSEAVNPVLMPDAAERGGDFSQAQYDGKPVQIFNPGTDVPFVNNVIPASLISRQAQSLLQYYPQPNIPGSSVYNYQVPLISNTHTDNFQSRVSKSFKRKNFLSGQYGASDTRSDRDSNFNFLDLTRSLGMQATASYRRQYTARFYGTFTYQFSRQSVGSNPFFSNLVNVSGAAGITGNNQEPLNWGPPSLGFQESGITGLSDGTASITHNQTSAYGYIAAWSHGRHNIQFGGDFRWQQFNTIGQNNPRGTFSFNGDYTQATSTVNGVSSLVPSTGFDFADFLLGTPDQSAIAFGNADKYLRAKQPDLFFQDDWKVSPGFSVTLALRWEYTSPITEKYGRLVNLDVAPGFTAAEPVLASNPVGPLTGMDYPFSLIRPDKREFRPGPAFAWRPFPASSMVVRGGYVIAYNTQVYNSFANTMAQQSPLSTSLSIQNSAANPLTLANGFSVPANLTSNTIAVNPNFKIGYAQLWNFSVQRDLPGSLVMQATYSGTKGTHELQAFVPNSYPTGTVNPPVGPSSFVYYTSGGNMTREAGSLQLRRRMHNGFTASLLYTYAKSIDDASVLGGGIGPIAQNWLNLEGERGPSTTDQRHLANINMQYTSGMGMGGGTLLSGWRGKLVKDWTFVDGINLGTGLPITPIYPGLIGTYGASGVRASYTGVDIYSNLAPGYFLNSAGFSAPAAGEWGNAGIGSIRGPAQFSMNATMQRSFRLNDRFTLSLQINANNPLNHVVFGGWQNSITSPQFGTPINPNTMRNMSTVMRLTF